MEQLLEEAQARGEALIREGHDLAELLLDLAAWAQAHRVDFNAAARLADTTVRTLRDALRLQESGGGIIATCPRCPWTSKPYPSEKQARGAYAQHPCSNPKG